MPLEWRVLVVLSAALGGCAVENPSLVRDTTGAEIGWSCEYGRCVAFQESHSPPVPMGCGERTEHLVGAGALAILCAVSQGPRGEDVVHEPTCRPLACRDELDCPQWQERSYVCIAEICQAEGEWSLDRVDVTALCLFDVPRHASCGEAETDPVVVARVAMVDAVCDERRCTGVPAGCLAP